MLSFFNSIVLQIAVILLIITLAFVGYIINNSIRGSTVKFPPVIGVCPDYWSATEDKNGTPICVNTIKIGNADNTNSNSNTNSNCDQFITNSIATTCDKYSLAKSCCISWDGITNNQDNRTACT